MPGDWCDQHCVASQAVRQPKIDCTIIAESLQNRVFWRFQTPNCYNLSEKLSKVSGQIPTYSRFRRLFGETDFDLHWVVAKSRPKSIRSRNLALHLMSFREVKAEVPLAFVSAEASDPKPTRATEQRHAAKAWRLLPAVSYDTIQAPFSVTSGCLCHVGNILGKSCRMSSCSSNASAV